MIHVQECTCCQENKDEYVKPGGLLQPLPIPQQKWEHISMDFNTGLSKTQVNDSIMVVVDRLTKFAHFFAISTTHTTIHIADLFFRDVFRLHGIPLRIVSDRDNKFMSVGRLSHLALVITLRRMGKQRSSTNGLKDTCVTTS